MKTSQNSPRTRSNCNPVLVLLVALMTAWVHHATCQTNALLADSNLEAAVRDTLDKPTGDLTRADLLQLTSLYAPNYRIKTLSGLEAATNLMSLDVSQNEISHAAAVASLPQLTALNLSWNYLRDLSPLLGLTNLVSLFLDGNSLESFPPLEPMARLDQLGLADNHISDLSPLMGLTSLRYLNLTGNPITSLAALCGLPNLYALGLGGLAITNADSLACLTYLTRLELYDNQIGDLTPLHGLTNLQGLDLSSNPVSNWTTLAGLTNLLSLSIRSASLSNLDWLAALRSLSSLELSQNSIFDLSPLSGLTNLSSLDMSQNPLTNCTALALLPNLEVLYLEGNSITNLSFVTGLPQLMGLSVTGNRIADLTPVAALTNLLWLNTGFNVLTNISALEGLPKLQSVSLYKNLLDLATGSEAMGVIQTLQSHGVSVNYQPQLALPQILIRPQWLMAAGQKSWLTFLLQDGANSGLQWPTVVAHSSNPGLIPETTFVISHSSDYYVWDLALTPAKDQAGTATLTLAATNYGGLWTNITIQIQVVSPAPFNAEPLDSSGLAWSTGGDPAWFGQNAISHDGVGAAQSGGDNSWLQTTVTGPGTLRFWFKLESDYHYANAQFSATSQDSNLHGYEHLHRSGEIWQQAIVGLPTGEWVLKWSPSWDSWSFGGSNTLWLDQVSFVPGPPACWLEQAAYELPNSERELYLHGALGQTYEVQVSSDLRNWSPLMQVTCENFKMPFRDWKLDASARFYRGRALP